MTTTRILVLPWSPAVPPAIYECRYLPSTYRYAVLDSRALTTKTGRIWNFGVEGI